jgi:hypothetical protein
VAVTVSVYNQAAALFAQGAINAAGTFTQPETADKYKVALYTNIAAPFTAADVSLAALTGGTYTEVVNSGYTAGGLELTGVTVTQSANDATLDANDASWTATGAAIDAAFAILYRKSKTGDLIDRPLLHINFGQTETAAAGTDFKIVWSASGIFSFVVT